jgi:hypothetical protein
VICQPCGAAGDLYAAAVKPILNPNLSVSTARLLREKMITAAVALHEECPGGTNCDCQHRVGIDLIGSTGAR